MDPIHKKILLLAAVAALVVPRVFAQAGTKPAMHATLEGWVHDLRVLAWDREGSAGGRYFDRGVFRYRTARMDHEYDLDMFTSGFTLAEDADFYRYENGFRGTAVSVTTLDLASDTELRTFIPLAKHLGFRLESDIEDDFTARRLALKVGYEIPVSDKHRVGLTHSLARAKADMDWGLYYRYRGENGVVFDADITALDGINNIITGQKVSHFNRDTVRTYDVSPFMAAARISSPITRRVRGEAVFGIQNRSDADILSLNNDSLRFNYANSFWYAGLLVEVEAVPGFVTAGVVAQFTSSSMARTADLDAIDPADYETHQPFQRFGLFALGAWKQWHANVWIYQDHLRDEQEGTLFGGSSIEGPYLFEASRTLIRTEASLLTSFGLEPSLSYEADFRRYPAGEGLEDRFLGFIPHTPNNRLTLNLSYNFSSSAVFDWGLSIDLDNDHFFNEPESRSRYDGMYFRLRANW